MESLYQNCVSQFDIDLLDHATSDNQTASLAVPGANPVARKQNLRFLKHRWKQVSDLVKRGKEANRVLEEVQKQLFEKNEECKDLCNERNTLFNQSTESASEIETLKAQNKLMQEKYLDAMNTVSATEIHSMQFKELAVELEKVQENLKKTDRDRVKEKKARDIAEKTLKRILSEFVSPKKRKANKWLQHLTKKYCVEKESSINNNDSSEDSSSHEMFDDVPVPMSPQIESKLPEERKISNSVATGETDTKQKNADFDTVESVDTGRGSSLAFSDGDKSFHSPDYYMNDSPFNNPPNLCNKCHISKSDIGTSPIPNEMLNIMTSTATIDKLKTDACTSPVKIYELRTNPENSELNADITNPLKSDGQVTDLEKSNKTKDYKFNRAVENNSSISDEESSTSTTLFSTETPFNEQYTYENSLQENEIQTVEKKDVAKSHNGCLERKSRNDGNIENNKLNADDKECRKLNVSDDNDEIDSEQTLENIESIGIKGRLHHDLNVNQIADKTEHPNNDWETCAELPTIPAKIIHIIRPSLEVNIYGHTLQENRDTNNDESVCGTFYSEKEVTNANRLVSPVDNVTVLQIELEDESVDNTMHNENSDSDEELPTISEEIHVTTVIELEEECAENNMHNENCDSDDELPTISEEIHVTTVTDLERNISNRTQLQECLELNNSKTQDNNNSTDYEIQMIISKMTSLQPIITPLPQTPVKISKSGIESSQSEIISNDLNKSTDHNNMETMLSTDGIDEYLSVIRKKTREAVGLFSCLPGFIEKMITSMSKDKSNQELLRCLLEKESRSSEPENNSQETMQTVDNETVNEEIQTVDEEAENDIESSVNTQTNIDESMLSIAELKKLNETIVYENGECASEDDTLQQNWESDNSNEADNDLERFGSGIINLHRLKKNKLSKLQRFKLNVLPRCKIRSELRPRVKKLRFKPKPIRSTVKRKVTDADSSATLNEKAIYDKAVKFIADAKAKNSLRKEPRVFIEDCAVNIIRNSNRNDMHISPKSVEHIKRDLLKAFEDVNDKKALESSSLNKKDMKKQGTFKRVLRSSCEKSEIVHDNATEIVNRKRTISDRQNLDDNSMSNKKRTKITHVEDNRECGLIKTRRRGNNSNIMLKEHADVCENSNRVINTRRNGIGSRETSKIPVDDKDIEMCDDSSDQGPNIRKSPEFKSQSYNKDVRNIDTEIVPKKSKLIGDSAASTSQRTLRSAIVKQIDFSDNYNPEVLKKSIVRENAATFNKDDENDEGPSKRHLNTPVQKEQGQDKNTARTSSANNILCTMIEKYAVNKGFFAKKIPESIVNDKCDKLEKSLDSIIEMPQSSYTEGMNKLVADIRNWKVKHFITAFTKYLKNPQRKLELYKKTTAISAPTMTKKEQIWIYVLDQLMKTNWCENIVEKVLAVIEYTLLALNKTPEMEVIESMSHFYALICRYYLKQSRLRVFIIDAMYCLSYKSIPLVMQCMEVWMFIFPLGHMGLAKTPLVSCLVYLLHFYKCGRSSSQVQDMRTILHRKYYYNFSEWNENKVLDMFRASILELRDCELEKKMLRIALIILAKRNGPKWCQNNIIKNMLQPIIENAATTNTAKRFCILALGPLVKPYPVEMKSYNEVIAHYLLNKLENNNCQKMQEAIITSLLFMNKHNSRINEFLFKWSPNKISPEFEDILKDYARSKSVKAWKHIFSENVTVTQQ